MEGRRWTLRWTEDGEAVGPSLVFGVELRHALLLLGLHW